MAKKRGCAKGSRRDSSGDCRNYKKETAYEMRPEQVRNRRMRDAANERMLPGKDPPGKEVDHIRPLNRGGHNGASNTRITSRSFNRKRGAKARA